MAESEDEQELPSGTVTFCLTDIEGSTQLLRGLGDAYLGALTDHRRILAAAFTSRGGTVVSASGGDGLFVAFSDACAAALACVEAQQRLEGHAWPMGRKIRVRIGLHTGEATPLGGDYISLAVNQAARVSDAAHGGQILLSDETARAIGEMPADLRLRDLGRYRLKDFDEPARLYQLSVGQDDPMFPPARAVPFAPPNLPQARDAFVGRTADLRRIRKAIDEASVVTLVGPGGVGKTRTATEVARLATGRFPDGIRFVDLAPLVDGASVPGAVASAVMSTGRQELPGDDGADAVDALAHHLAGRQLLLIDNCEHVIDSVAELVDSLLDRSATLRVLATSRSRLRIPGEQVVHINPLTLPRPTDEADLEAFQVVDSVRLFLERARRARADFTLTSQNAAAVAAIVRRLDGMPLALELAAARIAENDPTTLAEILERDFTLLEAASRTSARRHKTLDAVVRWSYDLLDAEGRSVLRLLGVFSGWFDEVGLRAVTSASGIPERQAFDLTTRLVERSLVMIDRDGRRKFRLLAAIRAFAAAELASDANEHARAAAAHMDWAVEIAEAANAKFDHPSESAFESLMADHHDDLKSALAWADSSGRVGVGSLLMALALARFDQGRYLHRQGRGLLSRALDAAADVPPLMRGQALRTLGVLAWHDGDFREATRCSEEGLVLAKQFADIDLEARCYNNLGAVALSQNDYAVAKRCFEHALALARELGSPSLESYCQNHLGLAARITGDWSEAMDRLQRALSLARSLGDVGLEASSLPRLGGLAWAVGRYDLAFSFDEEGLALARRLGRPRIEVHCLMNMGYVAWAEGAHEQAMVHFERARACSEKFDLPVNPEVELAVARVERSRGRLIPAARRLSFLLESPPSTISRVLLVEAVEEAALLARAAGRNEESAELADASASLRRASGRALEQPYEDELTMLRKELEPSRFWSQPVRLEEILPIARKVAAELSRPSL